MGEPEFPELKRQVAQQADLWKPNEIYVEDKASGQSLVQEIKTATSYPIIPIKIDRDKESRASACTGYFEAGRVLFPEGAPWLADLEDELASFPGGLHDDQVDALCQALNRLRDSGGVLGVLNYFKDIGAGKRTLPATAEEIMRGAVVVKRGPVQARSEGNKGLDEKLACPSCKSVCTIRLGGPGNFHCNSCGSDFDIHGNIRFQPPVAGPCCGNYQPRVIPGGIRCASCGTQVMEPQAVGISRAAYERGAGRSHWYDS